MPEPTKVNVVSYGGVKPGQLVVGNTRDGGKETLFDAATATDGSYVFRYHPQLTSWYIDLPSLTNGGYMFSSCTGLTTWDADLKALTNCDYMFSNCTGLTTWNGDLGALESGEYMFNICSALTTWNGYVPKLKDGKGMFNRCTRLTTWNGDLGALESGEHMFSSCVLSVESALRVLETIPNRAEAGLAEAPLAIGMRTNWVPGTQGYEELKTMLGVSADTIAAGTYHIAKGWAVTVQ